MANLVDAAALAVDPTFLAKVTAGLLRYATQYSATLLAMENPKPNDKLALGLCKLVLLDPNDYGARFSWSVASVPSVGAGTDDDTITLQIAAVWNVMAGVTF